MGEETRRVIYGQLASDLSFVTRALRASLNADIEEFYDTHQLPSGGIAILCLIGLNQGLSQKELGEAIVLKKSAMTKIVHEMEAEGLVERRKAQGDQRLNALYLTPDGKAYFDSLMADMRVQQDRFLAPLSPGERTLLFEMLWRLIDGLEGRDRDPRGLPA